MAVSLAEVKGRKNSGSRVAGIVSKVKKVVHE
jgi:hypothetical protein